MRPSVTQEEISHLLLHPVTKLAERLSCCFSCLCTLVSLNSSIQAKAFWERALWQPMIGPKGRVFSLLFLYGIDWTYSGPFQI